MVINPRHEHFKSDSPPGEHGHAHVRHDPLGKYILPVIGRFKHKRKRGDRWKDPFPQEVVLSEETLPVPKPVIDPKELRSVTLKMVRRLVRDQQFKSRNGDRSGALELQTHIDKARELLDLLPK